MVAERGCKGNLPLRGRERGGKVGRPEALHQALGQQLDGSRAVLFAGFDNLHQGGPAEGIDAEEARAEGRARLAFEHRGVHVGEGEGAGDRPFAGLRRLLEYEGVRGVETDGAKQLHRCGPPVSGSSHEACAKAGLRGRRSGSVLPRQRTRRSPLASSEGMAPFSSLRCCKKSLVTVANSCVRQASTATMRWRAKLSTSRPEPVSSKPSSCSAAGSGSSPASSAPMATVRIMAPKTSQSGGVLSSATAGPRTP